MRLYKLTDQNNKTKGSTTWGPNVKLTIKKVNDPRLCTGDVLHAYKNLNLAFLLNPCHAMIKNPRLWAAKGKIVVEDWGKVGCAPSLTTIKELPLPGWYSNKTMRKRVIVQFAVLCAEAMLFLFENRFPSDKRPLKAINAAKDYLNANTAARAADAAARAAADAAAYAADAAAAAAAAARAAADAAVPDFCALADEAVRLICGEPNA